ncbi:MAG: HEPN domain-containing protein [Candidatus Bathyarchaeia archaeon]|nr:HEPN domain-containing protein [Candidatus Bathyarchaeota archaeon]
MDESEYLRWILFSRKTLNSARGDFERGDYNWACFKSHQAAELALKALLRGLGMPSYGHSLSRLLEGAGRIFGCEDNVVQAAKTLDKYYVPTRYPNAWVEGSPDEYYTRRDAEEAIKFAENIIGWVEGKWGSLKKGEG